MGPDGRLYFSIGDRGLFVKTADGRTLAAQDTGSVLRCNPDGSDLEIFATGLRNPQHLAFDQYGNLFTGDNNADGGDAARWVHVVQGGDSGWRIGYQYLPSLGPWNAEKLWHKADTNTAAYLLPPLEHIANGPSGLSYFPGTGLIPAKYKDHFFLCDFRGGAGGSGIWSFTNKAKGASFELTGKQQFVWSVLATDCQFGPDGGFYLSDWVDGWGLPFKGRIYKVHDGSNNAEAGEVKKLLAEGLPKDVKKLAGFLGHADMRVRQEAQFALAANAIDGWNNGDPRPALAALTRVAKNGPQLGRIHAIWGLGQYVRATRETFPQVFFELLKDEDPEIRAQMCKTCAEHRIDYKKRGIAVNDWAMACHMMIPLLNDPSSRVRFFAAQSMARIGNDNPGELRGPIMKMLEDNADRDRYLRHAGVLAMAARFDQGALLGLAKHPSASVRLAAVLAMRRQGDANVSVFLNDNDPKVVLEATRAICDTNLTDGYAKLAALLERPTSTMKDWPASVTDPLFQRAAGAAFRLGSAANAQALARFAARTDVGNKVRIEALKHLSDWASPPVRDRVDGLARIMKPRPAEEVSAALRPVLARLMAAPGPAAAEVRNEGVKVAAKYGIKDIAPVLRTLVADKTQSAGIRVDTFLALEKLKDNLLFDLAKQALKDEEPRLRHQARRVLLPKQEPGEAVSMLADVAEKGAMVERQGSLGLLADLKTQKADEVLERWLDLLLEKKAPPEMQLDILEAAKGRTSVGGVQERLKKIQEARAASAKGGDHLAEYRASLFGGDAEAGKKIFFERAELSCLRCHKVGGVGGEVGPDLTGIGTKQKRDYLLESIVDPNRQIAKGFETVVLSLTSGKVVSGILKTENEKEVHLMNPEGQTIIVAVSQIDERSRGKSAMPEDLKKYLSPSDLRNLIEYLAGL